MKVLALDIHGFRGIPQGRIVFPDHGALVGPNGSGKSTIVDALSLVFGRQTLVPELTEHDFSGSSPEPADRIKLIATLGGFRSNNPDHNSNWFRSGRAVERFWDTTASRVIAENQPGAILCAQIGYAARFDHEDLTVRHIRYFQQHDEQVDPFDEEVIDRVPDKLLTEVGFFVLPARRTWAFTLSFGSEIFRKAVATIGGVPATTVLQHRDALRNPDTPLEMDEALRPLVQNINTRMSQLFPDNPRLQLRLTSTDSDSLLRALVPHYQRDDGAPLPAGRHGTGLVSLQTLVLLLEIGRARRAAEQSFILALEEPELHVPPGLQRRLIGDAVALADQVICTTHAPRVAGFFDGGSVQILSRTAAVPLKGVNIRVEARPLVPRSMVNEPNALIQLFTDDRIRVIEALMFPRVLIPEGRLDSEWLRLLLHVAETGVRTLQSGQTAIPPFGASVGVVPTRSSAVRLTYECIRGLHDHVGVLVDGDHAGDRYIAELLTCKLPPTAIVQWPAGWVIEDAVRWTLDADPTTALRDVNARLDREFSSLDELVGSLKSDIGQAGGLKTHYMAHDDIAAAMRTSKRCVERVELVLEGLTRALLCKVDDFEYLEKDMTRSRSEVILWRFRP